MVLSGSRRSVSKAETACKAEPHANPRAPVAPVRGAAQPKLAAARKSGVRVRKPAWEDPAGDCVMLQPPPAGKTLKRHKFLEASRKRLAAAGKGRRGGRRASSANGFSVEVPRGQTPASSSQPTGAFEGERADAEWVNRRTVAIGTDCSGMDTPVMALRNLNVKIDHAFSCDVNKHAKTSILENFPPKMFFDDLKTRDLATVPKVDIYVAGFPCQPFSAAGLQQGFDDARGRGTIFWHVREYIDMHRPRAFVLENVAGLVRINNGQYFKAIMESLNDIGKYNVKSQIINTKDHGIPQNRGRIYFVGILKAYDDGTFDWPEPVERPSIELFLEPRQVKPSDSDLPLPSQTNAYANVLKALKEIRAIGCDPLEEPFIVDIDSSGPRMKFVLDVAPCLTCSRNRGHWVTNRGRRFTKTEMMRLQGMCPEDFKVAVSEAQLGRQIGNAMSVNVLERLFVRILPASGLVRRGSLNDRWQSSVPVSVLAIKTPAVLETMGKVRSRAPEARQAVTALFAAKKIRSRAPGAREEALKKVPVPGKAPLPDLDPNPLPPQAAKRLSSATKRLLNGHIWLRVSSKGGRPRKVTPVEAAAANGRRVLRRPAAAGAPRKRGPTGDAGGAPKRIRRASKGS